MDKFELNCENKAIYNYARILLDDLGYRWMSGDKLTELDEFTNKLDTNLIMAAWESGGVTYIENSYNPLGIAINKFIGKYYVHKM